MDNLRKELCRRIKQRTEARGCYVLHGQELAIICPPRLGLHKRQTEIIEKFAAQHELSVTIRDAGIIATFTKKSVKRSDQTRGLVENGKQNARLDAARLQSEKVNGTPNLIETLGALMQSKADGFTGRAQA